MGCCLSTPIANKKSAKKGYLKALPLRALDEVAIIKEEISSGNILILRITPLARKNIDDVKTAVNELCEFTKSVGGDIARLGEERVVIVPNFISIWRGKNDMPSEDSPTAA